MLSEDDYQKLTTLPDDELRAIYKGTGDELTKRASARINEACKALTDLGLPVAVTQTPKQFRLDSTVQPMVFRICSIYHKTAGRGQPRLLVSVDGVGAAEKKTINQAIEYFRQHQIPWGDSPQRLRDQGFKVTENEFCLTLNYRETELRVYSAFEPYRDVPIRIVEVAGLYWYQWMIKGDEWPSIIPQGWKVTRIGTIRNGKFVDNGAMAPGQECVVLLDHGRPNERPTNLTLAIRNDGAFIHTRYSDRELLSIPLTDSQRVMIAGIISGEHK